MKRFLSLKRFEAGCPGFSLVFLLLFFFVDGVAVGAPEGESGTSPNTEKSKPPAVSDSAGGKSVAEAIGSKQEEDSAVVAGDGGPESSVMEQLGGVTSEDGTSLPPGSAGGPELSSCGKAREHSAPGERGLYLYRRGRRHALSFDGARVAVFLKRFEPSQAEKLLEEGLLKGANILSSNPAEKLLLLQLADGSKLGWKELSEWIATRPEIDSASFVLLDEGRELVLSRRFLGQLCSFVKPGELQGLLEEWKVKLVRELEVSPGLLLLEVESSDPGRTLEVANRFWESGFFEEVWPDFLTEVFPRSGGGAGKIPGSLGLPPGAGETRPVKADSAGSPVSPE